MNLYQQYIHLSRYSRWKEAEGRRETWPETVERFMQWVSKDKDLSEQEYDKLSVAIESLSVMPSMRALMTAGPAAERDNGGIYNCGYVPIEGLKDFADMMHILMNGTGVGFSVERQYVSQLPKVPDRIDSVTSGGIVVADSKAGWCSAFQRYLHGLFAGKIIPYDTSQVRPAGARLHTMGGRASGPQPLIDLFEFTREIVCGAAGRNLTSAEAHEICCKIAQIVVVGGVRRSALISLSNLSDPRMRDIKKGNIENHLYLSNNSVCYTEKPDLSIYMQEMQSLYESKSGERGIYNRQASKIVAARSGRRDINWDFGTNPCSEIILRPRQFCNLTEAVVRPTDTMQDLRDKVEVATIMGTLQSTFADFQFIDDRWRQNTEEERLLGVSLTGIMDHPVLADSDNALAFDEFGVSSVEEVLSELRQVAVDTNKVWAERLGINQSTAITCVKPSGTVSQLVDSASGIHDRYSPYYIRRVRADIKDPVTHALQEMGVPNEPDQFNPSTVVFSFPMKAPDASRYTTAMQKLKLWLTYQDHWCEHKPSVTVNYKDDEYLELIAEIYKHFDNISGISLLPSNDHVYPQAPYEEITEEEYNIMLAAMPSESYVLADEVVETQDNTDNVKDLACSAGACDI